MGTKPKQLQIKIVQQKEVSGIEMGVLSDGTAFLTGRGLAVVCGVAPSVIIKLADEFEWSEVIDSSRNGKIQQLLTVHNHREGPLYTELKKAGTKVHAYPESVSMAIIEYYAFEAGSNVKPTAQRNYRALARSSLRAFIYKAVGYDPEGAVPDRWRQFHDRVTLNLNVSGHFNVFAELAGVVVELIRNGLVVDDHTIPDISVGQKWGAYWEDAELEDRFGKRKKAPHNYPEYFPQAKSNPQQIWFYPVEALGEFRKWLFDEYVPKNFPKYIQSKVKQNLLAASTAELVVKAVTPKGMGS